MKAHIISQFGHCPLAWMFHSRGLNNKINSFHERTLSITYGHRLSSFQDVSKKDNSVSIHRRNIQALATEMFKVENNIGNFLISLISLLISLYTPCHKVPALKHSEKLYFYLRKAVIFILRLLGRDFCSSSIKKTLFEPIGYKFVGLT